MNDEPLAVTTTEFGDIIVTGQSQIGNNEYKFVTVKYESLSKINSCEYDSNNNPIYINNEVVLFLILM